MQKAKCKSEINFDMHICIGNYSAECKWLYLHVAFTGTNIWVNIFMDYYIEYKYLNCVDRVQIKQVYSIHNWLKGIITKSV